MERLLRKKIERYEVCNQRMDVKRAPRLVMLFPSAPSVLAERFISVTQRGVFIDQLCIELCARSWQVAL